MKWFNKITQNTDEWFNARAGLATTSNFGKIITPSGKPSSSQDELINTIIAELILGEPINRNFNLYQFEWGQKHEGDACDMYQFLTGQEIQHGGFFTNDDMTLGSSPDIVVIEDGNLVRIGEIKCPENPAKHVEFLRMQVMNPKYKPQVQGQMFITDAYSNDWFSYYPNIEPVLVRTERDQMYIDDLEDILGKFLRKLDIAIEEMLDAGHIQEVPRKTIDADIWTPTPAAPPPTPDAPDGIVMAG